MKKNRRTDIQFGSLVSLVVTAVSRDLTKDKFAVLLDSPSELTAFIKNAFSSFVAPPVQQNFLLSMTVRHSEYLTNFQIITLFRLVSDSIPEDLSFDRARDIIDNGPTFIGYLISKMSKFVHNP